MPASNASLQSEWALLRAACSSLSGERDSTQEESLRNSLQRSVNWEALLQLADQHGVAPILYQILSPLGGHVPPASLALLEQRYETNLHRTLILARELIRILNCLEGLGIDVVPYKGVALAETLYGDIALRQAGDIDLLVRPREVSRIRNALTELGYTPHLLFSEPEERAYLESGYERAFDSPLGRNLVEVQWALLPRFYAVDLETESLFRRAIPATVAGRNTKMLSPEDMFIVLSLHAAKHVWGRLIWLCDISRVVRLPALNWEWISEMAKSLGIVRVLQVTLALTNRLLQTTIPQTAERVFSPDSVARALAEEIAPQVGSASSPDVESLGYFRLMMRLRERSADRIKFLRRLAFTPGPGEWRAVRLPAPLFPLYRLVRLSRLATRFVRT